MHFVVAGVIVVTIAVIAGIAICLKVALTARKTPQSELVARQSAR